MTEPGLVVRHDLRWLELNLPVDAEHWAAMAVDEVVRRHGAASERSTAALRRDLARFAALMTRLRPAQAFLLCPSVEQGVVTIVEINTSPLQPEATSADVVAALRVREDELVEPPEIGELADAASAAVRLRQRYVDRTSEHRGVHDMMIYAWPDPAAQSLVLASTTFIDPLLASRWISAVDELARGVQLLPAS